MSVVIFIIQLVNTDWKLSLKANQFRCTTKQKRYTQSEILEVINMKTQERYYRNVISAAKQITRMAVDDEADAYQLYQDLKDVRDLCDQRMTEIKQNAK